MRFTAYTKLPVSLQQFYIALYESGKGKHKREDEYYDSVPQYALWKFYPRML